ncbi:efflux RND transporter periplasmic adaptor subunit [Sulfurovum sp.]|uniref:efflux RND transporter periplasmic adaptor subunit n=1 Tax=Sulfurovum sp. TaxID=1969726 RepID=UPI002867CC42|nr:efflux RND transporter periplasmic adaptor subunit [Sulfurovum sp.]
MKNKILLLTLLTFTLHAGDIVLTAEQEENWQIKVKAPKSSQKLPLGEFIAEVVTPPSLLHTISLPFDANVKKLNVANYQYVKEGQILANVTGTEWIATQQKAISDTIELKYHEQRVARKNMLCKEEIIPQKECTAANAELEAYKIKVSASKALLESYGASDEMIGTLFKELKLSQTIPLTSTVAGRIVKLNASPGKSTSSEDALFIIQEKGSLWLESDIEVLRTQGLKEGQKVQITLANHTFDTTILQLSPVINAQNQTRQVRFLVPLDINVFAGLRTTAKITLSQESYKVKKIAVIKDGDTQIVFVKTKKGYRSVAVKILAEDDRYYYVETSSELKNKIAVTSLAVLKNMLGEDDE